MKHGRIGLTRPEDFPKRFRIYRNASQVTDSGRFRQGERELVGETRCILSIIDPREMERYNQMGVTVTHTIIQRGAPIAKERDVFALVKGGEETRHFVVQAVHNHGEMDIDTCYICEERGDRW